MMKVQTLSVAKRLPHGSAELPAEAGMIVKNIPQPHPDPLLRRMPLRHAENWIQADTAEGNILVEQRLALVGDIFHPRRTLIMNVGRLGDEHFMTIALPHPADESGE